MKSRLKKYSLFFYQAQNLVGILCYYAWCWGWHWHTKKWLLYEAILFGISWPSDRWVDRILGFVTRASLIETSHFVGAHAWYCLTYYNPRGRRPSNFHDIWKMCTQHLHLIIFTHFTTFTTVFRNQKNIQSYDPIQEFKIL